MKASFISTVFNEEKNIKSFLNSLLEQTKKLDEIIIVDGGSTDRTYEILEEYAKKYKQVQVFQEKGANIARGRNLAISMTKFDIILVSDAGCVIDKIWASEMLKYFPKEDIVASGYKAIVRNSFEFIQSLLLLKKVDRPARISSRSKAFKKSCWKEVGGYPEGYRTGEDNRFIINLKEKGYRVKINHKPLVSWEMAPSFVKFSKQFYDYGKGERKQKNLSRKSLLRNFLMVLGFWAYIAFFIVSVIFFPFVAFLLLVVPVALLVLYSIKFFVKTGKISSLFWIPVLWISKRMSYILGVTFK